MSAVQTDDVGVGFPLGIGWQIAMQNHEVFGFEFFDRALDAALVATELPRNPLLTGTAFTAVVVGAFNKTRHDALHGAVPPRHGADC